MRSNIFVLVLAFVLVPFSLGQVSAAEKTSGFGTILMPDPDSWRLVSRATEGGTLIMEFVRASTKETIDTWQELLTVTIVVGLQKQTDAYGFAQGSIENSKPNCPKGIVVHRLEKRGTEALAEWQVKGCPQFFPDQYTMMRVVTTHISISTAQYAWKGGVPSEDAHKKAVELIEKVTFGEAH